MIPNHRNDSLIIFLCLVDLSPFLAILHYSPSSANFGRPFPYSERPSPLCAASLLRSSRVIGCVACPVIVVGRAIWVRVVIATVCVGVVVRIAVRGCRA
jgi:hypothetical protein